MGTFWMTNRWGVSEPENLAFNKDEKLCAQLFQNTISWNLLDLSFKSIPIQEYQVIKSMKITLSSIFFVLVCFVLYAQPGALIWEDNFNQSYLDPNKWTYEEGTGVNGDWGTGQLDRATKRPENVSFQQNIPGAEDGCLVITTRKEFYIDRTYTSGRINTAGKASWGPGHRIVTKAFPRDVRYKGQGFAFWMMPDEIPDGWDWIMWPQGGEVDIMEYVGSIPYHNLGGVHYAWFWENNQWQSWNHGHLASYYSFEYEEVPYPSSPGYGGWPPNPGDPFAGSSGFHNYGIDWYHDRMEFFVDDQVYHIHFLEDGGAFDKDGQDELKIELIDGKRTGVSEYSNHFDEWHPFEHKMFVILSGGVGGSQNTYGGPIVPEAEFPCSVFIDWVRVYELDQVSVVDNTATHFNVFPNPTSDVLHFDLEHPEKYLLTISDISGERIIQVRLDQSSRIDISDFISGSYLAVVNDGKTSLSRKFIVR